MTTTPGLIFQNQLLLTLCLQQDGRQKYQSCTPLRLTVLAEIKLHRKRSKAEKKQPSQRNQQGRGFEFLGWYDKNNIFDFESTSISKNISLTAKWKLEVPNYLEVSETTQWVNNKYETHYTITSYIKEKFPEDGVVTIPGNITDIDSFVFQDCTELRAVYIPASVVYIGNAAFKGCVNLKSATFENTSWYYKTSPYIAAKQITWQEDSRTNALWLTTGTYSTFSLFTDPKR